MTGWTKAGVSSPIRYCMYGSVPGQVRTQGMLGLVGLDSTSGQLLGYVTVGYVLGQELGQVRFQVRNQATLGLVMLFQVLGKE